MVVTLFRNVPDSKWWFLPIVLVRVGISSETVARQYSQMQPGACMREKRRSCCYPVSLFHICIFLLLFFPPNFCTLLALDTGHLWAPVIHKDVRRYLNLQDSALVAFQLIQHTGNAKFVSSMYKHTPMPPFCYGTVYICV